MAAPCVGRSKAQFCKALLVALAVLAALGLVQAYGYEEEYDVSDMADSESGYWDRDEADEDDVSVPMRMLPVTPPSGWDDVDRFITECCAEKSRRAACLTGMRGFHQTFKGTMEAHGGPFNAEQYAEECNKYGGEGNQPVAVGGGAGSSSSGAGVAEGLPQEESGLPAYIKGCCGSNKKCREELRDYKKTIEAHCGKQFSFEELRPGYGKLCEKYKDQPGAMDLLDASAYYNEFDEEEFDEDPIYECPISFKKAVKKPVNAPKKPLKNLKKPVKAPKQTVKAPKKPVKGTKKPLEAAKKPLLKTSKKPLKAPKKTAKAAKKSPVKSAKKPKMPLKKKPASAE